MLSWTQFRVCITCWLPVLGCVEALFSAFGHYSRIANHKATVSLSYVLMIIIRRLSITFAREAERFAAVSDWGRNGLRKTLTLVSKPLL